MMYHRLRFANCMVDVVRILIDFKETLCLLWEFAQRYCYGVYVAGKSGSICGVSLVCVCVCVFYYLLPYQVVCKRLLHLQDQKGVMC
jgi:hypothetical protein